ncbi:Rep [Bat associated circovirus 9]|uniref:Replication-associated protein n=1 Tax=Bat associated circovirus 9 TaxID=2169823 RepID=A0A0D3MCG3_9CIRC|nr:Rep [Bat associated circovirus 9]AIF76280.1 Rep [Bat associated circovirus 9]
MVQGRRRSGPPPHKRWCFTINNPTPAEERHLREIPVNQVDYLIAGREVGAQGTPHIQGFVNFVKKKTLNQVKLFVGPRAHVEKARGSDEQNRDYCSKDGDILVDVGCPRRPGARHDLASAVSTALSTGDLGQVAQSHPETYVKYHRGLAELIKASNKLPRRAWKTEVHVHVGPPGCGKSKWASEFADPEVTYWKPPRNKWWDGYASHEVVILDDFYGWLPFDELLRICDRYPLEVEVKGGLVPFLARTVIITSNKMPQEWYSSDAVPHAEALYRRITTLISWQTAMQPSTEDSAPQYLPQALTCPCSEFPYEINY